MLYYFFTGHLTGEKVYFLKQVPRQVHVSFVLITQAAHALLC